MFDLMQPADGYSLPSFDIPTFGATSAPTPSGGDGFLSGAFQTALSLGNSYLSRRLDVDLQTRLAEAQRLGQMQANAGTRLPSPIGGTAGFNLGGMLPLLLLGAAAFFLLRKA